MMRGNTGYFGRIAMFFLVAAVMAVFYLAMPQTSLGTDNPRELELEQQRKSAQMEKLKKQVQGIQKEANGVEKFIRDIDKQEKNTTSEISQVQKNLERNKAETSFLEKQFKTANQKFETYRQRNEDRLVGYYKNGRAGYMEVLFNSTSFSDLISRVYYLQLLTKHDLEIMNNLRALKDEVTEKKVLVEKNTTEIAKQHESLRKKKTQLQKTEEEKRKVLESIRDKEELLKQQLALLEKENQEIQRALQRAQSSEPVVSSFGGTFGSPVCGRQFYITSPFGHRAAPKRGASTNHQGLDLRAAKNSDICAAADGVVFLSTYGSGYGNYIIIRHGSSFATVYGHGTKRLVKEGDKVRKGQVIMKAGSTGASTAPHLHFEIRKNGVTVNPAPYYCRNTVSKGTCN